MPRYAVSMTAWRKEFEMSPKVKQWLDEHYPSEEPTNDERYYITFGKIYALEAAGLIKRPTPDLIELPLPELGQHATQQSAAPDPLPPLFSGGETAKR